MIYFQAYWLAVICVVFALFENGLALRCWKCSSEFDSTCRDYFNTTRILLNQRRMDTYNYGSLQPARNEPHLADCDGMHTSTFGEYKNVCLKRVMLVPHGPKNVIRECRMVSRDHKLGACPEDITYNSNSKNLDFCGTCEGDGCNSAGRNSLIFAGLVPAVILLLGK